MPLTREAIKKAALSLFAQGGYEGARLADIAKAVNIKAASLYFHFENKEQLFVELFDDMRDKRLANIDVLQQKIKNCATAKERLFCLYSDYSSRGYEHSEELIFWKRCALFPPNFLKEKINIDLIAYQKKFIDELLKPVIALGMKNKELKKQDVNKCVVSFLGVIAAIFSEIHYSKQETYEEKLEILWELFWDSLKK